MVSRACDEQVTTTVALPAVDLKPLKQGELDGLCGLYAGINALRLLFAKTRPLKCDEVRRLFSVGIARLSCDNQLACTALGGCDAKAWRKLIKAVVAEAVRITETDIIRIQPFRRGARPGLEAVFKAIEAAVREDQSVLIELEGYYQHFTVISACTPTRLELWDSGSLSWLTRRSCRVDDGAGGGRHVLIARTLTILRLAEVES